MAPDQDPENGGDDQAHPSGDGQVESSESLPTRPKALVPQSEEDLARNYAFDDMATQPGIGGPPPAIPGTRSAPDLETEPHEVPNLGQEGPGTQQDTDAGGEATVVVEMEVPPLPIKPSLRIRSTRKHLVLPLAVGGLLAVILILVLAWPAGETEDPPPGVESEESSALASGSEEAEDEESPTLEASARLAVREPVRPTYAHLEILSDPRGCKVSLNGMDLAGHTPLRNVIVPADLEHEVVVSCKGFRRETRRIKPPEGQKARLDFFPTSTSKSKRGIGRLQLVTTPRALVYLGKKKLGWTPILGLRLKAGQHRLRLVNKAKGVNKTLEVTIEPGRTTNLQKKF